MTYCSRYECIPHNGRYYNVGSAAVVWAAPDGRSKESRMLIIVYPENPIGIEIIELVSVGFTHHVCDLALIPTILSMANSNLLRKSAVSFPQSYE